MQSPYEPEYVFDAGGGLDLAQDDDDSGVTQLDRTTSLVAHVDGEALVFPDPSVRLPTALGLGVLQKEALFEGRLLGLSSQMSGVPCQLILPCATNRVTGS